MPDPSVLSPLGLAMVAQLPPQLRGSYDYLAVINALSKELELLEAAIEVVRAQSNPATADVLLDAWEWQLKLPVGGTAGATVAQRRADVLTRLRKVLSSGEGREWESTITSIVGPGWSYLEHDPADSGSPTDGVIQIIVPFASGSSKFIEAQDQIRDITDAHLEIQFESSSQFELDVSELDQSEFGA
jgi:hypothetical protein